LTELGFAALATTSSGFAGTLGRLDMHVTRDELLAHVGAVCGATPLPVNADAERCFADDPDGVADTVASLAAAGAAGCSIEDWDPAAGAIDPRDVAVARVRAAASAADRAGLVLTARCENLLHGVHDLDDTIERLCAYRDAGAHVVYAPGLVELAHIARVVRETEVPVNVLLLPGGPTVAQLADAGVRRVSLGGALASVAFGAMVDAARAVLANGQLPPGAPRLEGGLRDAAFGAD
jgi:2-methylisocitrate lyase-like PEP mutase family enzyme